jgi:hypothetical protein
MERRIPEFSSMERIYLVFTLGARSQKRCRGSRPETQEAAHDELKGILPEKILLNPCVDAFNKRRHWYSSPHKHRSAAQNVRSSGDCAGGH